ncbi:hypothetical protein ACOME3_010826 [Neoechinorhynchus agilis]
MKKDVKWVGRRGLRRRVYMEQSKIRTRRIYRGLISQLLSILRKESVCSDELLKLVSRRWQVKLTEQSAIEAKVKVEDCPRFSSKNLKSECESSNVNCECSFQNIFSHINGNHSGQEHNKMHQRLHEELHQHLNLGNRHGYWPEREWNQASIIYDAVLLYNAQNDENIEEKEVVVNGSESKVRRMDSLMCFKFEDSFPCCEQHEADQANNLDDSMLLLNTQKEAFVCRKERAPHGDDRNVRRSSEIIYNLSSSSTVDIDCIEKSSMDRSKIDHSKCKNTKDRDSVELGIEPFCAVITNRSKGEINMNEDIDFDEQETMHYLNEFKQRKNSVSKFETMENIDKGIDVNCIIRDCGINDKSLNPDLKKCLTMGNTDDIFKDYLCKVESYGVEDDPLNSDDDISVHNSLDGEQQSIICCKYVKYRRQQKRYRFELSAIVAQIEGKDFVFGNGCVRAKNAGKEDYVNSSKHKKYI